MTMMQNNQCSAMYRFIRLFLGPRQAASISEFIFSLLNSKKRYFSYILALFLAKKSNFSKYFLKVRKCL